MTDELYHKWREKKEGSKEDKFDVEDFIRAYKRGKRIIDNSIKKSDDRKKAVYSKIEEARLKLGLQPSKTFGGAKK